MASLTSIPDPPEMDRLPWYGKERLLPRYRFVPGLYPHPIRDPEGHSQRSFRARVHPPWLPEEWPALQAYLYGIDLFNRFYFWEAHEVWENLWKSHPPDSGPARFVQGLINVAASFLKLHMEEGPSSRKLRAAALSLLDPFRGNRWMGIQVDSFLKDIQRYTGPLDMGILPKLGGETPSIRLDPGDG